MPIPADAPSRVAARTNEPTARSATVAKPQASPSPCERSQPRRSGLAEGMGGPPEEEGRPDVRGEHEREAGDRQRGPDPGAGPERRRELHVDERRVVEPEDHRPDDLGIPHEPGAPRHDAPDAAGHHRERPEHEPPEREP